MNHYGITKANKKFCDCFVNLVKFNKLPVVFAYHETSSENIQR